MKKSEPNKSDVNLRGEFYLVEKASKEGACIFGVFRVSVKYLKEFFHRLMSTKNEIHWISMWI